MNCDLVSGHTIHTYGQMPSADLETLMEVENR